jgi:hypothetical protein
MAPRRARPTIPFDAIRILLGMGLSAAYEERKREGREDG